MDVEGIFFFSSQRQELLKSVDGSLFIKVCEYLGIHCGRVTPNMCLKLQYLTTELLKLITVEYILNTPTGKPERLLLLLWM